MVMGTGRSAGIPALGGGVAVGTVAVLLGASGLLLPASHAALPATVSATVAPSATPTLLYSTSSSYGSPRPLAGASVTGKVAVFVRPGTTSLRSVTFSLDGRPSRTEYHAPYDLVGDRNRLSRLLDTSTLRAGTHSVRAVVTTTAGRTSSLTASFTSRAATGATASWPAASHVGPTGVLTPSGSIRATTPGMVIENKLIRGGLIIDADNVTVRNVKIEWNGRLFPLIVERGATGAKFDRFEIDGRTTSRSSVRQDAAAVIGDNYTMTNFHIHDVPEGPRLGSDVTMRTGLIERLVLIGTNHVDGMQIIGVTKNSRVEQVAIKAFSPAGGYTGINAALQAGTERGDVGNVVFARNFFDGGYVPVNLGGGGTRDAAIRFENNLFGRGSKADLIKYTSRAQTFANNIFTDNGAPVPLH